MYLRYRWSWLLTAFLFCWPLIGWAAPTLTSDVTDVVVPNGSVNGTPATFSVSAMGTDALSYQWHRVETHYSVSPRKFLGSYTNVVAGQTGAELTVTEWQPTISRTLSIYYSFAVRVTDSTGSVFSRAGSVTVAPPDFAPSIYNDLQAAYMANEDQSLTFDFGVSAYPMNIFWYRNAVLMPGLTNSFMTIPAASLADAGQWWAVCSNALGSVTSRVAAVTVLPAIQFSSSQLGGVTIDLDHLVKTNWNLPTAGDLAGNDLQLSITGGQAPFVTAGTWTLKLAANGTYTVEAGVMPAAAGQWTRQEVMQGMAELKLSGFYADGTAGTLTLLENRYFELSKQGVVANQHGNWSLAGFEPTYTDLPKGTTFSVVAVASGDFTFSYQWLKDGVAIPEKTGTHLIIDPATVEDSGVYTCVVTRSDGKTRTSPEGILTVVGGGSSEIALEFSPGTISLSWPAGTQLESKAALSDDWSPVEAESPVVIPTTGAGSFYRWVKP